MLRQRNKRNIQGKELSGEAVMDKLVGIWWGERVGGTEHHA